MNFEDFKKYVTVDPHYLADIIRQGDIYFNDIISYVSQVEKVDITPIIKFAILVHPDCTIKYFKEQYRALVKKSGSVAKYYILEHTHLVSSISIIAYILHAEENTIESIKATFIVKQPTFKLLLKNPKISKEFKVAYYELTGDESSLPEEADIFLF